MDPIGDRMKSQYEDRFRVLMPRRTYTVVRVDGKAFHTWTRGCTRPYDESLMAAMDETAKAMCEEMQGARLAYVQSDEISILLADFDKITTSAWFDGNLQKVVSVSASLATGYFNDIVSRWPASAGIRTSAFFDARAFTICDPIEVENYLIWRQQDATRNSISMAAQSRYSPKQLHGKNTSEQQEMLFQKGINWNNYPARFKRGGAVVKAEVGKVTRPETGESQTVWAWTIIEPPIFTQERGWLRSRIPVHPDFERRPEAAPLDACPPPRVG